jgi:2-haloacid dehalogenase
MTTEGLKALFFDVFGTCVDWRTSIANEGEIVGRRMGLTGVDWTRFADSWRAQYQPQLETVRLGRRPWAPLDTLHREALDGVLSELSLDAVPESERTELTMAWHRLQPWPDVVVGLTRLKQRFIIAPNSNGNIALQVNLAKHAGLPWDVILGAETAQAYKPQPDAYLTNVRLLGLKPSEVMMVAAHNADLAAAASCGLRTAFVARTREHGRDQTTDLRPAHAFDAVARDFLALADELCH